VGADAKPQLPVLWKLNGEPIDLAALASRGPLALTFYRRGWRPYRHVALKAFADRQNEFAALGASVVAIAPELPEKAGAGSDNDEIAFPVAGGLATALSPDRHRSRPMEWGRDSRAS